MCLPLVLASPVSALAWQIVQEWLATPWGGDRHMRRVALIREIEEMYARSEA